MTLINLTPHAITVRTPDGDRTFPPSGKVARVSTTTVPAGTIDDRGVSLPLVRQGYGPVEGLPTPIPDVGYIVSLLILGRPEVSHRRDVFAPDTSPGSVIRNDQGHIEAVRRLICPTARQSI